MKRITLFVIALFALVATASAQLTFGAYTEDCGFLPVGELVDDDRWKDFDIKSMDFAVRVDNVVLAGILDKDPENLVLAFASMRIDDTNYFENGNIRTKRIPGEDYIFYIKDWDLTGESGVPMLSPSGGNPMFPLYSEWPAGDHLHAQVLVASAEGSGLEFWWDESTAAGWNPGAAYIYIGEYKSANGVNKHCLNTDCELSACTTGISDTIADEMDAEIVGYYTLLGQKLSGEPENGIFLVKYSNGKTVKLMK